MNGTFKVASLAALASLMTSTGFAYEDQWQPSNKTLLDYVASGYLMSQPVVLHLSPFERVQYRYYLTKGQAVAQCTEDVTTRKGRVVDKILECADLAAPFQK